MHIHTSLLQGFFVSNRPGGVGSDDIYKLEEKRMPNTFFPIAHDSGGNLICMDSNDSKIYFWDHEKEVNYYKSDDNDWSNLYFIADNLNDFISNLTED